MHKFVIFIPLCAALAFTQTGTELIGVVFNKENMDAILGASSSGSHAFATSLAKGLGLGAMAVGQIAAAVVVALVYCASLGYSSAVVAKERGYGAGINAAILLAGSIAGLAAHARFLGQFDPKSVGMLVATLIAASLALLAVCCLLKVWLDDDAAPAATGTAASGNRLAAISARKRQ